MTRWWERGEGRRRVIDVLDTWGDEPLGAEVDLRAAAMILTDALASTPVLRGGLSQPRVRVLEPAMLMGGDFDLVCALGFAQGLFPAEVHEDPLLDDELLARLEAHTGAALMDTTRARWTQRVRLASLVAGCAGTLWISCPEHELLEDRPRTPSMFSLEVLGALRGRRVSFSALREVLARPPRREPGAAITRREHLLSRLEREPRATTRELVAHPGAARLMDLHRGIDRSWAGERVELEPASGAVDPELLAPPAQADAWGAARLLQDPSRYFFEEVLEARSGGGPRRAKDPLQEVPRAVRRVLEAAREEAPKDLERAFRDGWDAHIDGLGTRIPELAEAPRQLQLLRQLGLHHFEQLQRSSGGRWRGARQVLEGQRMIEGLELGLCGELGEVREDALVMLGSWASRNSLYTSHTRGIATRLQALALREAGHPISHAVLHGADGSRADTKILEANGSETKPSRKVRRALERAAALRAHGWWPVGDEENPWAFWRERERAKPLTDEDIDRRFGFEQGGEGEQ